MSAIPVVDLLGDELERAAVGAASPRRSRRGRRFALLAVAGALVASGSALATGVFSGGVEQQATASIVCYDGADPDFSGSVALIPREAGSAGPSPAQLCRRYLAGGPPVPELVACSDEAIVAVIPGSRASDCVRAGFAPLDPAYAPARRRAARLERAMLAIEASDDCIAPGALARRVQQLFERAGWNGWTVTVRRARGDGSCGSVSSFGGDGRRYIHFEEGAREVTVFRTAPRRINDLLYSADRSLLLGLFTESGAACFSFDELSARVKEVFAAHDIRARVSAARLPRGTGLDNDDGRMTRYDAGCAVLAGGGPGPDRDSVAIELFVKS